MTQTRLTLTCLRCGRTQRRATWTRGLRACLLARCPRCRGELRLVEAVGVVCTGRRGLETPDVKKEL